MARWWQEVRSQTIRLVGALLGLALLCGPGLARQNGEMRDSRIDVWIGSQTGIHHLVLDRQQGKLLAPRQLESLPGAGFLAWHPAGERLLATAKQEAATGLASYRVRGRGNQISLVQTGFVDSGDGGAACVAVDATGRLAFSAQYGGGSVASYGLNEAGDLMQRLDLVKHGPGSGVDPKRQAAAHPHWVGMSPGNRWLAVPDLGMDVVAVYEVDAASGKLTPRRQVPLAPGAGPRHMKFHPHQPLALVLNELDLTLSTFRFTEAENRWEALQTIPSLPRELQDSGSNTAAEVRLHPNGRFAYTSNRGHDSITVFALDRETGGLTEIQREPVRGSWPRNFEIDPSGRWLIAAGQFSNTLALFAVDPETGRLEFSRSVVNVPDPTCVLFGKAD